MKGYCKCGVVIDEVEYAQFGACEECYAKESEQSVEGVSDGEGDSPQQSDSKVSFWNSYPIENLTPEQRKHFKKVMRKELNLTSYLTSK